MGEFVLGGTDDDSGVGLASGTNVFGTSSVWPLGHQRLQGSSIFSHDGWRPSVCVSMESIFRGRCIRLENLLFETIHPMGLRLSPRNLTAAALSISHHA